MANVFYKDFTPISTFSKKPSYEECLQYFVRFISNFSYLKDIDVETCSDYFEYFTAEKNGVLCKPNQPLDHIIFVCQGAVKSYKEDNKNQYIINFVTNCNFTLCLSRFINQLNALNGYVATQRIYGLKITYKNYKQLIKDFPEFAELFSTFSEKQNLSILNRLTSFQSADAKGRYNLLVQEMPDAFNAFSMYDIANYLGINPETLSRLKNKKK